MASDAVFDLIRSMTPGEKRYFRKNARHNPGKKGENYLELFDILEGMTKYNEEEVKKRLSNPTYAKNLSFGKNYLYRSLLESLRDFHLHSESQPQLVVAEYWANLHVLIDKGLNKQAFKLIGQAKKFCRLSQMRYDLLKFLEVERNLISRFEKKNALKKLDALVAECETLNYHLAKESQIITLYERLFLQYRMQEREGFEKAFAEFEAYAEKHGNYLAGTPSLTFKAFYFFSIALKHEWVRDYPNACKYHGKVLELYERDEQVRKANMERYLHLIYNYIHYFILSTESGHKNEFDRLMARFDNIPSKSPKFLIQVEHYRLYLNMLAMLKYNDYPRAVKMDQQVAVFLKRHGDTLTADRLLSFKYHMAVAHFMLAILDPAQKDQGLKNAIHWLNEVENTTQVETKSLLRSFSRIYFVLAHFESGNHDLVGYLMRNFTLALKADNKTHSIEYILFTGLKKVLSARSPESRLKHMQAVSDSLQAFSYIPELHNWAAKRVGVYENAV